MMRLLRRRARAAAAAAEVAPAAAQTPGQFREIKALAFDAYGTLFDVFSVTELCEQLFPGKGNQLAQTWRFKQVQYSLMRSLTAGESASVLAAVKDKPAGDR